MLFLNGSDQAFIEMKFNKNTQANLKTKMKIKVKAQLKGLMN